jgi:hypothetical protein
MRRVYFLTAALGLMAVAPASPQVGGGLGGQAARMRAQPKLEAVAETRLLMDGINWPNFQGAEQLLKQKPGNAEVWTILRGQALLIAENGNLLLLRPPRNQGEDAWMDRATDLRTMATKLARAAADRDYQRCRTGLTDLANTCNRCHQTFGVSVKITAFENRSGVPAPPEAPPVPQPPQPKNPPPPPQPPRVPGGSIPPA